MQNKLHADNAAATLQFVTHDSVWFVSDAIVLAAVLPLLG